MSSQPNHHPFLDDLREDVTLVASVLRKEVSGRDAVLKVVKAGAAQYRSQTPTFLREVEDRRFFEYDFELASGTSGKGLVSIVRDADGGVIRLTIAFSPLHAVLEMAAGARDALADELGSELFL